MNVYNNNIGQRFTMLRAALHEKSQRLMAEKLKVSHVTMYNIESGKTQPSLEVINRLCSLYTKINKYWLIDGFGDMFTKQDNSMLSQKNIKNINSTEQNNEIKGGTYDSVSLENDFLAKENKYLKKILQLTEEVDNLKKP